MHRLETALVYLAAIGAAIVTGSLAGPIAGLATLAAISFWLRRLLAVRAPESPAARLRRQRMEAFRRR
jgi:hypothetical protein